MYPADTTASSASSPRLSARTKGREKPQLSCNFCRRRKLRCDRKQPCDSCTRLGQASACSFPFLQPSRTYGNRSTDPTIQNTFQERIDQLESLVRFLAAKQQDKNITSTPASTILPEFTAAPNDEDTLTHGFGRIHLQAHESSYVESDHWTVILDEISDLKDMVNEQSHSPHSESRGESAKLPGADLFFFQTYPTTKMEIIAAVPPRPVVDSIVAKYFSFADMPVALVIHRRVFFKQYEKFWEDPLGTPIMWITILFGIMFMVSYFTLYINGGLGSLDEETLFEYQNIITTAQEKMIQCLRLGNYMKGTPHTIEALLCYLQVEYAQGEGTQQGIWQLVGVIIRVALKMGYHRDGSHFPELSVFETEMRRRIWYILMQFDTASASQVGLPRLINPAQCDTAEPRSLLDDDFDDLTTVLPPARPQTEHTLSQFLIYKSRVVLVHGMICDFTTSSKQRNYDEAMKLNNMLNTAYVQKPSVLELKSMRRSIMDGAELITRRLYIAMSFHHAQMTLHRKFMILAKTNSKYAFSHTTCIYAALTVLRLQADLFEQCQPGRMLHADRWKILFLIQSEFLFAAIILCVNLDDDMTNARWGKSPLSSDEVYQKIVTALQSSQAIWKQQQAISKEAQTAVKAISVVLARAQGTVGMATPRLGVSSLWASTTATTPGVSSGAQGAEDMVTTVSGSLSDSPAIHTPTSPIFNPSVPQGYAPASIPPGQQADFNDSSWGEFFDMDRSWDTWLQL